MTHSQESFSTPPLPTFENRYELPHDQSAAQDMLRDQIARQYPEQEQPLHGILTTLEQATASPKDFPEEAEGGVDLDRISPEGFAMLQINPAVQYSREEISSMTAEDKALASATKDGLHVVGTMTHGAHKTIEGVYQLTGAEVVRDDRLSGAVDGSVIRKGQYNGSPVFFQENYFDASPDNPGMFEGRSTLSLAILGEKAAQTALHELTEGERKDFAGKSGVSPYDVRALGLKSGQNHDSTAAMFQEISGIGSDPAASPEAAPQPQSAEVRRLGIAGKIAHILSKIRPRR